MQATLNRIRAELTCPRCNEPFADPYIFPCMHCFCGDCSAEMMRASGNCPLCGRELREREAREYTLLKNIIERAAVVLRLGMPLAARRGGGSNGMAAGIATAVAAAAAADEDEGADVMAVAMAAQPEVISVDEEDGGDHGGDGGDGDGGEASGDHYPAAALFPGGGLLLSTSAMAELSQIPTAASQAAAHLQMVTPPSTALALRGRGAGAATTTMMADLSCALDVSRIDGGGGGSGDGSARVAAPPSTPVEIPLRQVSPPSPMAPGSGERRPELGLGLASPMLGGAAASDGVPLVLMATSSIQGGDREALAAVAALLHARVADVYEPAVTHLIAVAPATAVKAGVPLATGLPPGALPPPDGIRTYRVCKRTITYMQGVVAGLWVLGHEWLTACLAAGRHVPEAAFEVAGDVKVLGGPIASRLARSTRGPLFRDMRVLLVPPFERLAVEDVQRLLETGGAARVVTLASGADPAAVVAEHGRDAFDVGIASVARADEEKVLQLAGLAPVARIVDQLWLLDSISHGQLQAMARFAADNLAEEPVRAGAGGGAA